MQLAIPSELGQVRFLGAALRALLHELAYPEEQAASIELCLVEAVNNVIEHAYREEPGHLVEVGVCAAPEAIELTVCDAGAAMPAGALDEARAREAAQEARDGSGLDDVFERGAVAEGGYGLRLIIQVMNQVDYRRDGDRNKLTMSMKLGGGSLAAAAAT